MQQIKQKLNNVITLRKVVQTSAIRTVNEAWKTVTLKTLNTKTRGRSGHEGAGRISDPTCPYPTCPAQGRYEIFKIKANSERKYVL